MGEICAVTDFWAIFYQITSNGSNDFMVDSCPFRTSCLLKQKQCNTYFIQKTFSSEILMWNPVEMDVSYIFHSNRRYILHLINGPKVPEVFGINKHSVVPFGLEVCDLVTTKGNWALVGLFDLNINHVTFMFMVWRFFCEGKVARYVSWIPH